MSSSKGLGLKARDLISVLPPNVGRFLFSKTDYREAIEFDPSGTLAISSLFDEYDRSWNAYVEGSDETLSRTFEFSQTGVLPPKEKTFISRFRDVVNYIQLPNIVLVDKFNELKGELLTSFEKEILEERERYARVWLKNYAPEEVSFQMAQTLPDVAKHLTDLQKNYLVRVAELIREENTADELQIKLYNLSKELELGAKEAFSAIYIAFTGRESGPKAAWFLLQYPKDVVVKRLMEAAESKEEVL